MALPDNELDQLDREIILDLQEDARISFNRIARRLMVSESTVANRVRRLRDNGVLKLEARVNPAGLSHRVAALVGLNLERRTHQQTIPRIEGIPGVTAVWSTTGKYDLFIEVMFESMEEFNDFLFRKGLSGIEGIISTESFLVLESGTKYFKIGRPQSI